MGIFGQLGALFWKNYVTRKRQPITLVLEVVWPILIFVIIAVMRSGSPPGEARTCSYSERALPSAGMVPFLQTSVCMLENKCETRQRVGEKASAMQKLRAMVQDVSPLITKDTTLAAIKSLPTVNKVLIAVSNITENLDMDQIDDKLRLRKLFRSPDVVTDLLVNKYAILSSSQAKALLDSSFNLVELLKNVNMVDFKAIVCDPVLLGKYILFKSSVDVRAVSTSLCAVDESRISDITNDLVKQLDMANILQLVKDFSTMTGQFDMAMLMNDLAGLAELFMDQTSLASMLSIQSLSDLPAVMRDLSRLIPMITTGFNSVDFDSLQALYKAFDPMLKQLIQDPETLDALTGVMDSGARMVSYLSEPNSNWTAILQEFSPMLEELDKLMNSSFADVLKMISDIPVTDVFNNADKIMGNITNVDQDTLKLNDSLVFAEGMLREIMSEKDMNMMMALGEQAMSMADDMMALMKDTEATFTYSIKNSEPMGRAINALVGNGQNATQTYLVNVLTPTNIYGVMTGERDVITVCLDAARDSDMTKSVTDVLCHQDVVDEVEKMTPKIYKTMTEMADRNMAEMTYVVEGLPRNSTMSMKDMYYNVMDMSEDLGSMMEDSKASWNDALGTVLPSDVVNGDAWTDVWVKVEEQYIQTSLYTTVVVLGKSMENTSMWEAVSPTIRMMDVIMEALMNTTAKLEPFMESDGTMAKMLRYMEYLPNMMDALMPKMETFIAETLNMTEPNGMMDPLKSLCKNMDWSSLNISGSVEELKMFVCQTNFTKFVGDLITAGEPLAMLANMESLYMNSPETSADWLRMVENMQKMYKMLTDLGSSPLIAVWDNLRLPDLSGIMSQLTNLEKMLSNMSMDQVSSGMDGLVPIVETLDKSMKDVAYWRFLKHYIHAMVPYAKMANEYIEKAQASNFNATQYLMELSPTLGEYLVNSSEAIPGLRNAIQNIMSNPQKLLERMSKLDYMNFCTTGSISSLLDLQYDNNVAVFEKGLCDLNWTVVLEEMGQNEILDVFNIEFSEFISDVSVNWTEAMSVYGQLLTNLEEVLYGDSMDLTSIMVGGTNVSITDWMAILNNSADLSSAMSGLSQLTDLINLLVGNDTDAKLIRDSVMVSLHSSLVYMTFLNKQLEYFNSTSVVDIRAYLNSGEMNKLFDVMEQMPQLNVVLMANVKKMMKDPTAATKLMTVSWADLCNESLSTFPDLIDVPSNSNMTVVEVQRAVCSVNIDVDRLLQELKQSLDGFEEVIDVMSNMDPVNVTVNFTDLYIQNERYANLLMAVISDPPEFKLPWTDTEGKIQDLLKQLEQFTTDLAAMYNWSVATPQDDALQALKALSDIPGMGTLFRIADMYAIIFQRTINAAEDAVLDPSVMFADYPSMRKVWDMMQMLPDVYYTFVYTSYVNNDKITRFTMALVNNSLCSEDPDSLMTVPPGSSFDFAGFMGQFCSLNMTQLDMEATKFSQSEEIGQLYEEYRSGSNSTADITGIMGRFEALMASLTEFMNKTDSFVMPRLLNASLWEEMMTSVNDLLMNTTFIMEAVAKSQANAMNLLYQSSPELRAQWKMNEIAYMLMNNMLDKLDNLADGSNSLEDMFKGSVEMQKLLRLVQMKGVIESIMVSSNTPQFEELLSKTNMTEVLILICDSDITKYITVADVADFNVTVAQDLFCSLDFKALEMEFTEEFQIQKIMDMLADNSTSDWSVLQQQEQKLQERITNMITNPPNISLPAHWMDDAHWENMLMSINASYNDLMNLQDLIPLVYYLLPSETGDLSRIISTADLVLDLVITRLEEIKDNVSLATLTRNSRSLIEMLEALGRLSGLLSKTPLNESIDTAKLMSILGQPEVFMKLCENKTLSMYIGVGGGATPLSTELQNIVCVDPEAIFQSLQNQVDLDAFDQRLTEIWNSTVPPILDWTSLSSKVANLTELMTNMLTNVPVVDSGLADWLDLNSTINFLSELFMGQLPYASFANIYNPNLLADDPMNAATTEVLTILSKMMLLQPLFRDLQGMSPASLLNNPAKLKEVLDSLTNVDSLLNLYAEAYSKHAIVKAGQESANIRQLVCNKTDLLNYGQYFGPYSQPLEDLTGVLCGVEGSQWFTKLVESKFTGLDIVNIHRLFVHRSEIDLTVKMSWEDVQANLQTIAQLFENMDYAGLDNISSVLEEMLQGNMQMTLENGVRGMTLLVGMLDLQQLGDEIQMIVNAVTMIEDNLNKQLQQLAANGGLIPMTSLLPDPSVLANLLNQLMSGDTTSTIMLASINPEKFVSLMFGTKWTATVCNRTLFMETFTFPPEIDADGLQKKLCEETAQHETNLDNLFTSLDMTEVIEQLQAMMSGSTNHTISWLDMTSMTETFINTIIKLPVNFTFNIETWFRPIINVLESNSDPSASITSSCDATYRTLADSTDQFSMSVKQTLSDVYNQMRTVVFQMEVQTDMQDIICEGYSSLTDMVQKMKDKDLLERIKQLVDKYMGKGMETFSCQGMADVSRELYDASAEGFTAMINGSVDLGKCIENVFMMTGDMMNQVSNFINMGEELMKVMKDPEVRDFLKQVTQSEETLTTIDEIIKAYTQQQNSLDAIERAMQRNITNLEDFFQESLNIGPDAIRSLLNGTLGVDIGNMTSEELIDALCSADDQLNAALGMNTDIFNLNATLCGPDRKLAEDAARSLLSYSDLLNNFDAMVNGSQLWERLSADLAALIENIDGISKLAGLVGDLQNVDIMDISANSSKLLNTIQRLLVDNGPDALLDSLNAVLDDLGLLGDDNTTSDVMKDIKTLANGIFAFKSLKQMFFDSVKIEDLVKDPAELQKYLQTNLDIDPKLAEAIVEGSISFEMLMEAAHLDLTEWVCNVTALTTLLKTEGTGLDAAYISQQFCSLNASTYTNLMDDIFQQLDIGDLMQELAMNSLSGFLDKANVTLDDTKKALVEVEKAQDELNDLVTTVDKFVQDMPGVMAGLASAQTGTGDFASLAGLLCGSGMPVPTVEDEFNTENRVNFKKELTDSQKQEMASLPGKVCQDMYFQLMEQENGPIIWGFLKPILRGKILYTPSTPVATKLMKAVNSTFASLEEVTVIASDWAKGSTDLESLLSGGQSSAIQELLESTVVRSMLTQISGVSMTSLEDMFYMLNDTDPQLIKGLTNVATMVSDYVGCIEMDRFVAMDSERELEIEAARLAKSNSYLAGIVLTNIGSGTDRKKRAAGSDLPSHVEYKIRMDFENTMRTNRIKERMWRPYPEDNFASELRYFRGFIQLQDLIDSAIISMQTGRNLTTPGITTKQFPSPCHRHDSFVNAFTAYLLPIMMTISWVASISIAVRNLVYDREQGQEEVLRAMGMTVCLNWWAWFICTMVIMAIVALVNVVILTQWNLFKYSNIAIIYLYFIDFIFSTIMLCYFVSAFFTRTSLAILATLIVYFISYLPYAGLIMAEVEMTFWQKIVACLSSTTAFSFSAQYIARFEEQQIGIHWDNIKDSPMYSDNFSLHWGCIMMLIDGFIYLILGWYVRNVKPGKFGVSEPWYFIFYPKYWSSCCGGIGSSENNYLAANQDVFAEDFSPTMPPAMSIRGLTKEFSKGTKVVDNLCMDIYGGFVTTLLGHNGAAKTTTMNMLIGLLEPTKGSVKINNRPLRKMRESIGLCPQHNCLFEYMTVKEHMEFYSSMKPGTVGLSAKEEIQQLLQDVDLWYCRHSKVKELSGGMQRRLCVALAFVGGSRIVILDEPTSGVDPSGRRAIWNLIGRRKLGTAILLSTHHLDEADVIGDKIAIMHQGKLLCLGSPIFLKQYLTSGHRLTVVRNEASGDNDPSPIMDTINRWVSGARIQQMVGSDITYVLPASNVNDFCQCLNELEMKKEELRIVSYGISDPTLEEVFLKTCALADAGKRVTSETARDDELVNKALNGSPAEEWKGSVEQEGENGRNTSHRQNARSGSVAQKLGALLTKRFNHYRRNWRALITVFVLPLLLFLFASGFYSMRPDSTSAKNLLLTPAMYGPNAFVIMKKDTVVSPRSNSIVDTFIDYPGIGTTCMPGVEQPHPYECIDPDAGYTYPAYTPSNGTCWCDNYKYVCDAGYQVKPPRQIKTPTTDILQDLEGRDMEQYLLDSVFQFTEKRYGGWSFHEDTTMPGDLEARVWYNNKGHHALPAFMNAYSNGLLRSLVKEHKIGDAAQFGITVHSHPFKFNEEQLSEHTIMESAVDVGVALTILLAFIFFPVGVMMYLVTENVNRDKHMQFISGVGAFMYWFTAILWDMIVLVLAVAVSFGIIAIFQNNSFWERDNAPAVVCLLLMFGWATIPLMYILVRLFRNVSSAFFTMFCILNFIGIVLMTGVLTLNFYRRNEPDIERAYDVCRKVFLIFPPYALGGGMIDIIANQVKAEIFERFNTDVYVDPFSFDIIGWNLFAMGVEGLVFLIIAIMMDVNCASSRNYGRSRSSAGEYDDEDVHNEKKRVESGAAKDDVLVVRNLHKVYSGSREVHAVNGLTFGVSRGQCFGLLGVNGAGKTSTFNILTGALSATDGNAYILGQSVKHGSSAIGRNVGYCPQEDAMDLYLTVSEMLHFHAKLKGIPSGERDTAVRKVMSQLDLESIQNKTVRACSGGMKRRVSLGLALLGDPSVVLLDEPTTGMDPKAKRLVWNTLIKAKQRGQAILLTSHSLEECDILCDKIGIMVNGEFKCIGSSQHLKNKFGEGYTVTLNVCGLSTQRQKIHELINTHFPGSVIRDQHQAVIQLDIPREIIKVSEIFRVLEEEKANYNIMYYTVSQTTLDTVFLNFAREQTDGGTATLEANDIESESSGTRTDSLLGQVPKAYHAYGNPGYEDPAVFMGVGHKPKDPDSGTIDKDGSVFTRM